MEETIKTASCVVSQDQKALCGYLAVQQRNSQRVIPANSERPNRPSYRLISIDTLEFSRIKQIATYFVVSRRDDRA